MAEEAAKTGKGITGFLSKDTAGLPNWAWAIIVAAGLAAAYIVPKFFGSSSTTPADTSGTSSTDTSGIGLAVDPTTGLPYAVEGLVPSGGTAGTGQVGPQGPAGPTGPQGPPGPGGPTTTTTTCPPPEMANPPAGKTWKITGTDANGCPVYSLVSSGLMPPTPAPKPTPKPTATAKYVTVQKWPSQLGSLSGIASKYGLTLARLEQLNPSITNPNLIYAGERVRIA